MAGKGKGMSVVIAVGKPKGGAGGKFAPTKAPKMGKSGSKGGAKSPPKGMKPPTFGPMM